MTQSKSHDIEVAIHRAADALSECANALMRKGGMIDRDIAREAIKARSLLLKLIDGE